MSYIIDTIKIAYTEHDRRIKLSEECLHEYRDIINFDEGFSYGELLDFDEYQDFVKG